MSYDNVLAALDGSLWYSTPQQMEKIRTVAQAIASGNVTELRAQFEEDVEAGLYDTEQVYSRSGVEIDQDTGTAIVPIRGVMAKRMNMFTRMSGGTSTDMLAKSFKELKADDRVERVFLDVNSGGGSVQGVEVATQALRELSEVKETHAFANDVMASAAYYVGSAARHIHASPSSLIGSVGTVAKIYDRSEKLEEDGIDVHVVRSAPLKAIPDGEEGVDEKGLEKIEDSVKHYHNEFVEAIEINLQITKDEANNMATGETFDGEQAVEANFADDVLTVDAALESIEANEEKEQILAEAESQIEAAVSQRDEALEALEEANEQIEALETEVSELQAEQERTDVSALVDAAIENGKIAAQKRSDWIEKGMKYGEDELEDIFTGIPEGTVMPTEDVQEDATEAAQGEDGPLTKTERKVFAQFPSLREEYDLN